MGLSTYIVRRLLQIPLVLFFVTVIIFALMHVSPGDPISIMLGAYSTPEAVQALKEEYFLDRSLPEQYVRWLGRMVQGDMGVSIRTNEPVLEIIATRLPISIGLATSATLVALLVAIPAGIAAAYWKNTGWDYGLMGFTMLGLSVPNFTLALLLILVFSMKLDWLPISGVGFTSFADDFWAALLPFLLPTVSLAVARIAELSRFVRASMLGVLNQDYIRTAYAKGLSNITVLRRHAIRNALIPVVTIAGGQLGALLGGALVVEVVFNIPGFGGAIVSAVRLRDYPVIQNLVLIITVVHVLTNLGVDLLYGFLDPRISYANY